VAFPDSSPYVYTTMSQSPVTKAVAPTSASLQVTDSRSLRRIIREGIPKALSRPQERYYLEATSLTIKSLPALLALRGPGRTNMANGTFSIFADAVVEGTPLDSRLSNTVSPEDYRAPDDISDSKENVRPSGTNSNERERGMKAVQLRPDDDENARATKKRKLAVCARFGTAGTPTSLAALDRLDIRLLDRLEEDEEDDVDTPETHWDRCYRGPTEAGRGRRG
jgi:central kinetochore subunit Mis15/CHL4